MSVPILDASAWREYRGKPANSGINATTHMAKVADTAGKLRDCFVKLLPTDTPALLCEAIGWLLARKSDLSHPAFGAIILVPVEELRKCSPLPPEFNGMTLCPAWCSEVVSGKTVKQIHTMAFYISRKKLPSKQGRKEDRSLRPMERSAGSQFWKRDRVCQGRIRRHRSRNTTP